MCALHDKMLQVCLQGFFMLNGLSISPGFALGKIFCLKHFQFEDVEPRVLKTDEINTEIETFNQALQISKDEINNLLDLPQIRGSLEITNIFKAQLTLIDDPDLGKEVVKRIRELSQDVKFALSGVIKDYSNFFRNLPDPQFQGKAIDIVDVGKRILKNCQPVTNVQKDFSELEDGVIIVAENLTPSEIVTFDQSKIFGIATSEGTPTSHASILARSLGIPALIQVENIASAMKPNHYAILDGSGGKLIIDPDEKTKNKFLKLKEDFEGKRKKLQQSIALPPLTKDGVKINLNANIGQLSDIDAVIANNAGGVGLYRTEFAYLTRRTFPTEKELISSYSAVISRLNGAPVVIRTIDIGGDKISHLMGNAMERNPELGWRAVRMSLDCEDVFCTQLRAILISSTMAAPGQVKLLFPMISNLEELRKVKKLLKKIASDLREFEGISINKIDVGIMVEVPSVALMAHQFAKEVDFFSIGSNDLVQYTLAVDRTNSKVSHLYQPANPAVLRLMKSVVDVAKNNNIEVSICGEMAGDTKYTLLLLGLGLRELSMNAVLLPAVKEIVRNISLNKVEKIIKPLLEFDTAEQIEKELAIINKRMSIT